jgi:hypothetical protein
MSRIELTTRKQYTFLATAEQFAQLLTLNVQTPTSENKNQDTIFVNVVALLSVDPTIPPELLSKGCKKSKSKESKESKTKHSTSSQAPAANLVKMVVGTDDPDNQIRGGGTSTTKSAAPGQIILDPRRTNSKQNKQFRQNLRQIGIPFIVNDVIQIFNVESVTGTPGVYRIYDSVLECADIKVVAYYTGERALIFPLQKCACFETDGNVKVKFDDEVISAFIQVEEGKLDQAVKLLQNIKLATPDAPFDENQLCINANNVVDLINQSKESKEGKK